MKISNRHVYGTPEELRLVKEEVDWIGRNQCYFEGDDHLVILALPRKAVKKKSKPKDTEEAAPRGARREQKPKNYS